MNSNPHSNRQILEGLSAPEHFTSKQLKVVSARGSLNELVKRELSVKGVKVTDAESKTWDFFPDPWELKSSTGRLLLTISDMYFTIVRAPDSSGTIVTYMSMSSRWTSSYRANSNDSTCPHVKPYVLVQNAQGGLLLDWRPEPVRILCGTQNLPVSWFSGFSPDVYDIIDGPGRFGFEAFSMCPC